MKRNTSARPRGATSRRACAVVTVWLPKEMLGRIDQAVADEDIDRSKFVRRAIRQALGN